MEKINKNFNLNEYGIFCLNCGEFFDFWWVSKKNTLQCIVNQIHQSTLELFLKAHLNFI
jgi:hypothetical protein